MNILDEMNQRLLRMEQQFGEVLKKLDAQPVPHERMGLQQAAHMLGRSTDTVRRGCKADRYPHHRDGNRYIFFRDELQAYLDRQPTTAARIAEKAMAGKNHN